jgi:Restriction endonuclease BglII
VAIGHFPDDICDLYEIHEWRHASAILKLDYTAEWEDLLAMLRAFRLLRSWIAEGGGNKTKLAKWVDAFLGERGWREKHFSTAVVVDSMRMESPTHKVDCYKNTIALEVEWNNKDPFYDRDLNNFRLLFDLRTVSVGIIFTRCDELQDLFRALGRGKSYGNSTTHMSKLLPKILGGGGAGCPIIVIGIRRKLLAEDHHGN